jgi:hypothetical protein
VQPVTLGEIDQCLGAGAATVAGKDCSAASASCASTSGRLRSRANRLPHLAAARGLNGWLPVEQRKADRKRELEVRTTRQLRDKRRICAEVPRPESSNRWSRVNA